MSKELDVFNPQAGLPADLASVFDADALSGDLSEGAGGGGFQVLSFRGSKWRVKSSGDEHPILNQDGESAPSIEVVMLKANKGVSKIWYAKKYVEGDAESPDCFSIDGEKPDSTSTNAQAASCAACPHNQWGSRITENGTKAKACQDNRRVAVQLMANVPLEVEDEPMLLRVPAASLNDLATFGKKMQEKGYPYNAIITRIGFDIDAAYPKLTFKPVRPITNEEAAMVAEKFNSDETHRILNEMPEAEALTTSEVETPAVSTEFEEPEPAPKKKAVKKKAAKKSAKSELDEAKAVIEGEDDTPAPKSGDVDSELDSIIAELEGLD
jgi:hypothetical protein